ncbi:MAG TPA: sigma-E factor regulatory protein RseB domain-containing protein [Eoetvoesiella sp.]
MASFLLADAANPLKTAMERYEEVNAYQMQVRGSGGNKNEAMLYAYKKPGYVRLDIQQPFNGAVIVYDPVSKQATLWPFGRGRLPILTLKPENRLIRSAAGQRVDQSDVGSLYQNASALEAHGKSEVLGPELINGRKTVHVAVQGSDDFSVGAIHRYDLWLDNETAFPAKVASYGSNGQLLEVVEMSNIRINPAFPEHFFAP